VGAVEAGDRVNVADVRVPDDVGAPEAAVEVGPDARPAVAPPPPHATALAATARTATAARTRWARFPVEDNRITTPMVGLHGCRMPGRDSIDVDLVRAAVFGLDLLSPGEQVVVGRGAGGAGEQVVVRGGAGGAGEQVVVRSIDGADREIGLAR
jgi:hypothetical protein